MRKSRYPLEQVLAQRARACQQAELELVVARGRLHDAEKALAAAQALCADHHGKRTRLVTPTPEHAQVSAQAFAWSGAYAVRLREDGRKLAERAQAAQTVVTAQARALRLAELSWQRAYAEREALERHHERFKEAERKAAERAYELETEEHAHQANILQVRG